MSRTFLLLATGLLVSLSVGPVGAAEADNPGATEASLSVLLDTIRANRTALVAVNLDLSAEEAAKFWPLYERYRQELNVSGDRAVAVIEDYTASFGTLSNEKALQLMGDYLAAEADRVKVRQTYLGQFAEILPGRTVARLYQIENKMDAVIRYDLAATIPVVDDSPVAK